MGIVNRTPDSFFDGGKYLDDKAARARVDRLLADGADVIDVGAESTRPGAPAVPTAEQLARIGDLIRYVTGRGAAASIDTTDAEVATRAAVQGASMINSVSLDAAERLAAVAARHDCDLVLTHCRGSMTHMEGFSRYRDDAYRDVVDDVLEEWEQAAARAVTAGLARRRLWFDPGLGFTKNARQSLELCARLGEIKRRLGEVRLAVGPSRKSYLAAATGGDGRPAPPPSARLGASVAAALDCAARGADLLRVHDVAEVCQALAYAQSVQRVGTHAAGRREAGAPAAAVQTGGGGG